jgi:4-amino-4-deoxy-L-arabinose transferase-like glycosyltransferase
MISRANFFDKIRNRPWAILLLASNLLVVLGTELAYDEAYYWLFSRHLAWGYFDHPPATAWLIALTNWIPGELGVRLSFVIGMQLGASLLAGLLAEESRTRFWQLLNCFPLLAFAGVFAIPDGPLVFFSALWLWSLAQFLKQENIFNTCLMGLSTALLFYSKYHGILFVVGTLMALPRLLTRPKLWLAVIVCSVLFLPHVFWQIQHEFATFRYHFVDRPKVALGWRQPIEFLVVQLFLPGLLLGPYLWVRIFSEKSQTSFERCLKTIALFVPAFFLLSTVNKKMEANWTVAAGLPFLLFLAPRLKTVSEKSWWKGLMWSSLGLVLVGRAILIFPPDLPVFKRGKEFHGWKKWSEDVRASAGDCKLAANRYQIASKLSFYLGEEVPALNVGTRLNQFEFWDWEKTWGNQEVCWVTERQIFPGEPVPTPDGKKLVLVKGQELGDILKHKDRSL